MRFHSPLLDGILIRRYKRFLADVRLPDGRVVTAHTANTGSMLTCSEPGSPVRLSDHGPTGRKYRHTLELVRAGRTWVGVNTMRPNGIVAEAVRKGRIPELEGYPELRLEVAYGENSRIDLLLVRGEERCFVEVKNTTMAYGRSAYFPDARTERGRKHLRELIRQRRKGDRAVNLFLVHRRDCVLFRAADFIDPDYARTLRRARRLGVEILAYRTRISPRGTTIEKPLPLDLSPAQNPGQGPAEGPS